jgi:hypothetical protein
MGDDDAVARHHGPRGSPRNGLIIAQVVLLQLGVPAGGPAAAVGVVAVGQAPGRAVAGDALGIAFNAQAVTVPAQIAAAKGLGRAAGGPAPRQRGRQDAGPPNAAGGGRDGRVAPGGRARAEAAARGRGGRAGRDAGPLGAGGRPAPNGPAGIAIPRCVYAKGPSSAKRRPRDFVPTPCT